MNRIEENRKKNYGILQLTNISFPYNFDAHHIIYLTNQYSYETNFSIHSDADRVINLKSKCTRD